MLANGQSVRALELDDGPRLERMFERLSPETITRRFFTLMPKLNAPLLRLLLAVDHNGHEALVVTVGDEIVAFASYHRSANDPTVADVAVMVEDGWQHHGFGRLLLRALTALAQTRGITLFHADVLADNRPAIGLIHNLGNTASPTWTGDGLSYDLPLSAA